MQKFLIIFLFLFFGIAPVCADHSPYYINSSHIGAGVISVEDDITIYEKENVKSGVVALIKIEDNKIAIKEKGIKNPLIETTFIIYKKNPQYAFLSVEKDTDDFYYVCYDRKRNLFGWVLKKDTIDFINWESFLNLYGRKFGIYLLRNVPDNYKKLYSAPDTNSTLVDSFNFPKHIALWLIKGDWVLVKVTTYDGLTKTGWMRWKLDDNTIIAFPDFSD